MVFGRSVEVQKARRESYKPPPNPSVMVDPEFGFEHRRVRQLGSVLASAPEPAREGPSPAKIWNCDAAGGGHRLDRRAWITSGKSGWILFGALWLVKCVPAGIFVEVGIYGKRWPALFDSGATQSVINASVEDWLVKRVGMRNAQLEMADGRRAAISRAFPDTREEWLRHAEAFNVQWNFPHCLGALDGKHIVIQAPANGGSHYFNYKGTHSIVLLGVASANYQFTYIDVGCNGRVSDGGVFQNCSLHDLLENGSASLPDHEPLPGRNMPVPYFFVADDAFAMRSYILKPYPFRDQPAPNRIFNYRLSRARRIVENAFGIMANKFRVLRKPINLSPDITENIVLAVCALHNFLLSTRDSRKNYLTPGVADSEHPDTHEIIPGNWREDSTPRNSFFSLERGKRHNYTTSQRDVREEFKEYFMTPSGEVAWQYRHIV
ncbi:hypothetical protein J437_LFUL003310 [Ladona fulva]|uniref:DDE Tnp4 domain-containing protein n=1 Tax=Ladona fulva TaxID=123851 RepID=A0A8K0KLM4_LADFU|nr:hypothetical protein J437_LFUL003310 [Ladona fulva]